MSQLIADIGATNARFALVDQGVIDHIQVLACDDYATLSDAAAHYLATTGGQAEAGFFAVATELDGSNYVVMTNNHWAFSITETRKKIGLKQLQVMNDFEAIAYMVPCIDKKDCLQVGGGQVQPDMPIGIIGPGTGLGVAAVVFANSQPVPVATEGGHVTMPATTEREFALFQYLKNTKYSHISAERVISGKGLINLYHAINGLDELNLPEKTPAEITEAALQKKCAACVETLDLFCHFLGVVAGNLALTYGAFGGVYIAGGIVTQLGDYFKTSRFRESFLAKGRYKDYLDRIPTLVITHPYPGLEGLKNALSTR
ncbi:MAG: glucokinase [Proteobacteria bacterium]|nr:glucokinase [Pseudomonadota bacterium]